KRVFHLLPALAEIRAARAEVSIEIASAAVRPDYLTYRDLAEPEVPTREGAQPLGCLVEGKQLRRWRPHPHGTRQPGVHVPAPCSVEGGRLPRFHSRTARGVAPISPARSPARAPLGLARGL